MAKEKKDEYKVGACCMIGYITAIMMRDNKSGYTIAELSSDSRRNSLHNDRKIKRITVKGVTEPLTKGCLYRLECKSEPTKNVERGTWEVYFSHCEPAFDTSELGCINYLKSEVAGVGEILARQIYRSYGKQTIQILRDHPERVATEVHGVSATLALKISEQLIETTTADKVKQELYGIGITQWEVNAIFKEYGTDAIEKVKADCFALTKIRGLGFSKVSAIADKLGIPKTDPGRIKAALVYAMEQLTDEGHVCVYGHKLMEITQKLLDIKHIKLTEEIESLIREGVFATQDSDPADYIEDRQLLDDADILASVGSALQPSSKTPAK